MAFRLGERLIYGELRNPQPWQTFGTLWLRGEEAALAVELTGDCAPDLRGRTIRFAPRRAASIAEYLEALERERPPASEELSDLEEFPSSGESPTLEECPDSEGSSALEGYSDPEELSGSQEPSIFAKPSASEKPSLPKSFCFHQTGVPGEMTAARWVRSLPCSVEEYLKRSSLGEKPPTTWKRLLYLEWFGRNGRVVIELEDPLLEYQDGETWKELPCPVPMPDRDPDEPPEDPMAGLEIIALDDKGNAKRITPGEEEEEDSVPEWIPPELQKTLDARAASIERRIAGEEADDEDFMAETELMDDLIVSGNPDPPASLLAARRLPKPDSVSEKKAESLVKSLLVELAMWGVAVHACPHSTARQLYRILVEHVLFDGGVHRELANTSWTQNYLAAEYCPECEAESEAEFRRNYKEGGEENSSE